MTNSARRPTPPAWVKVSFVLGLVIALAFVALHVTGRMPNHGGHMHDHAMPGPMEHHHGTPP